MYNTILYNSENKICSITLNRPEKRNSFNAELITELSDAFKNADEDAAIKVIILKGSGKVFSAGADLAYLESMQKNSFDENLVDSTSLMELYKFIYTMSKPVIAQIEGHAIAGGCGLATVCDLAYSVPEAQFGYTEVKIGFVPAIVMVFLLRKINERNAKELLLTGKLVHAKTAKEMGLINDIIAGASIQQHVLQIATDIMNDCSRESLRATKQMIASVQELSLNDGFEMAAKINAKARSTDDFIKGINTFLEKKKPEWD